MTNIFDMLIDLVATAGMNLFGRFDNIYIYYKYIYSSIEWN